MNTAAMQRVADMLRAKVAPVGGLGFNMSQYLFNVPPRHDHTGHKCGTVGCIAGWTVVDALNQAGDPEAIKTSESLLITSEAPLSKTQEIFVRKVCLSIGLKYEPTVGTCIATMARHIMGLSRDQANELFVPIRTVQLWLVTPEQAAQAIENTIKSGSPDWPSIVAGTEAAPGSGNL